GPVADVAHAAHAVADLSDPAAEHALGVHAAARPHLGLADAGVVVEVALLDVGVVVREAAGAVAGVADLEAGGFVVVAGVAAAGRGALARSAGPDRGRAGDPARAAGDGLLVAELGAGLRAV